MEIKSSIEKDIEKNQLTNLVQPCATTKTNITAKTNSEYQALKETEIK